MLAGYGLADFTKATVGAVSAMVRRCASYLPGSQPKRFDSRNECSDH